MKKGIVYLFLSTAILALFFILAWIQPVLVPAWYSDVPKTLRLVLYFIGGISWITLLWSGLERIARVKVHK
jgi:hypothetical protein